MATRSSNNRSSQSQASSNPSFVTFEISSQYYLDRPHPDTGKIFSYEAPSHLKRSDDGRVLLVCHCAQQEKLFRYCNGELLKRKIRKVKSGDNWIPKPEGNWLPLDVSKLCVIDTTGTEIIIEIGESSESVFDEL